MTFLLLKREYAGDKVALRELFELVDDKAAVAALDREIMGQTQTIVTDR